MNTKQLKDLWWFCNCRTHFVHPTSQKQCDKCKEINPNMEEGKHGKL